MTDQPITVCPICGAEATAYRTVQIGDLPLVQIVGPIIACEHCHSVSLPDGESELLVDDLVTVRQVADAYGLSNSTIYAAIRHGWIPSTTRGKTKLLKRRDVERRWGPWVEDGVDE